MATSRPMNNVHRLITECGRQGALDFGIKAEVIHAAASYLSDEEGGTGFLYSGWCQAALPHKKLADGDDWQVEAGNVTLIVEAGVRPGPGGKPISVGVPYGSRARLILLYLQSEALRTSCPEVELGKSLRAWMARIGVPIGGSNAALLREQAERISRCRLTFHVARGDKVGMLSQTIVDAALFERADGKRSGFAERARLSDGFFAQLKDHSVPLDEAAIRAIANNSQAIDIYAWLAYRLHHLTKATPMSWAAAKKQFGLAVKRMDHFREKFIPNLELSLAVYPDAKVDITPTGLVLHPSRPPVEPRKLLRTA
ncbi:Plasmid replication initiator (plasmid) [Rhodovastum atsumiense]|nr:Plasmid replication initiator [Rhodovastum atsumiense]